MKRALIGLLLLAVLFVSGCKCTVEREAISQVENSHSLIATQLLKYVEADPKLSPKDKEDWKKLVTSDKANIEALKKATE